MVDDDDHDEEDVDDDDDDDDCVDIVAYELLHTGVMVSLSNNYTPSTIIMIIFIICCQRWQQQHKCDVF